MGKIRLNEISLPHMGVKYMGKLRHFCIVINFCCRKSFHIFHPRFANKCDRQPSDNLYRSVTGRYEAQESCKVKGLVSHLLQFFRIRSNSLESISVCLSWLIFKPCFLQNISIEVFHLFYLLKIYYNENLSFFTNCQVVITTQSLKNIFKEVAKQKF